MSQAKAEQSDPRGRVLHVGLVAGPESLANLGPVVRHLVVGLLDEPMSMTLVHPANTSVPHLPVPPVRDVPYALPRVPFVHRDPFRPICEALARSRPDLLHALDTDAVSLTRHLAADLDIPYVVNVMGMERPFRLSDPRCRMVLAGSEPIREALLESRAAPTGTIALLRPGIHRARHTTCFMDPAHSPAIVAAGPLRHVEPFAAAMEAFARLQAAQKDCVFFLVGNGRAEHALRRMAERLHLMHSLTFVDQQEPEQLKAILHGADLFIWPTPVERIQIDVLTAMSAGVPVLTPPMPAADFIIPDRTALIFEPNNADDLAAKLTGLLDDRAGARELAQNALALLKENHSPADMANQLADFYDATLGATVP
ncbi:MAG TPA: glycosyltransferase family 4 protein [Phycisphaerae bacterium]|nr:glycosyltransferase family 4 protein [Phycisphaerae bacterium]